MKKLLLLILLSPIFANAQWQGVPNNLQIKINSPGDTSHRINMGSFGFWYPTSGGGGITTFPLTINNSGSGVSSGTTFNGAVARTISWNSIGALPLTFPSNQTITLSGDTLKFGTHGAFISDSTMAAVGNQGFASMLPASFRLGKNLTTWLSITGGASTNTITGNPITITPKVSFAVNPALGTTSTVGYVPTATNTSGDWSWAAASSPTTIYTGNGSLSGNRTVDVATHYIDIGDQTNGAVDLQLSSGGGGHQGIATLLAGDVTGISTHFFGSLTLTNSTAQLSFLDYSSFNGASLNLNIGSNEFNDPVNLKGLEYTADYSANFTSRSIPDVAYVLAHSGGGVTSVTGTTNRITSTGGTTPQIDISATFEALLGKVASPLSQFASTTSAQLAGVLSDESGTGVVAYTTNPVFTTPNLGTPSALVGTNISGTGSGFTAGNVTTNANLTGPITSVGNATTITAASITNAMLAGSISNANLANSSITINGNAVSLGGSTTVTATATNALTMNNGGSGATSGTTFDGSTARTISYNTIGASPTAGSASLTTIGTIGSSPYTTAGIIHNTVTTGALTSDLIRTADLGASLSLTTPNINVATATSINGNAFTTGTYTLTGAAGKTLTFNNTLTINSTDGITMTTPTTSFTAARTDAANTFTGTQTFGTIAATLVQGSIQSNSGGLNTSNLYTPTVTGFVAQSGATLIYGGATTTQGRVILGNGSTALSLTGGNSYANVLVGQGATITVPNATTSTWITQLAITPLPTITKTGTGTVTNTATAFFSAASSAGTNNYTAYFDTGNLQIANGNLTFASIGNGIAIKEGTNAAMGTGTLSGGTLVISNTRVTANSRIFLTDQGGTVTNLGSLYISARSAGTSFTVNSSNVLDASTFAWVIIEPAP